MKEVGVFLGGLVLELGQLRSAATQGLVTLQAEHAKLEDEIRRAQERHQTVSGATLLRWLKVVYSPPSFTLFH